MAKKQHWLQIRVTAEEKDELRSAAAKKGQTMTDWAMQRLLREARKINR